MGSHQLLFWDFSNKATTNNNNSFGSIFGDFATKFSIIWKTLCERNGEKGCFLRQGRWLWRAFRPSQGGPTLRWGRWKVQWHWMRNYKKLQGCMSRRQRGSSCCRREWCSHPCWPGTLYKIEILWKLPPSIILSCPSWLISRWAREVNVVLMVFQECTLMSTIIGEFFNFTYRVFF